MEIMLPELLFSVGNSMQDISRDDFCLLNGEYDKDVTATIRINSLISSTSPSPIPITTYDNCQSDTPPPSSSSLLLTTNLISSNTTTDTINNIKLEDSNSNPYLCNNTTTLWHNSHNIKPDFESSKLLLRNSDDPLISRGATNDDDDNDNHHHHHNHPNELKSMAVSSAIETSTIVPNISTTATTSIKTECIQTDNTKCTKTVASSKRNKTSNSSGNKTRRKNTFKLRFHHQALPPEYLSHYEMTQNQQNKIINNNNNVSKNTNNNNSNNKSKNSFEDHIHINTEKHINTHETVRNWLEKISQIETNTSNSQKDNHTEINDDSINDDIKPIVRSSRKIVKYSDLPYMGEMTLENSKPRRGRKPKKADICHLIYKNYGTILPGTPQSKMELDTKDESKHSLLEKCLSKDIKESKNKNTNSLSIEEPLNLCLRDRSGDSFLLSSDDEASDELGNSNRTSPIITQTDPITDEILAANLKMSLPNFQSALLNNKSLDDIPTPSTGDSDQISSPNFSSWQKNSGVFLHPMALYYQKLVDGRNNVQSSSNLTPSTCNNSVNVTTTKSQSPKNIQNKKQPSPKLTSKILPQLIKREKSDHAEPSTTPSSTKSSISTTNTSSSTQNPSQPTQKRKRSAIFIPPMPAENTTNPATEVSICKFKFTGGAKPSLQEKKMLSVDSDGNYRYYSGTGDKSTRGYEFFPRETLQQSGVIPGVNCSGAFLNATGEKILGDFPAPSSGLSNELLQIPDSPTSSILFPSSHTPPLLSNTSESCHHHHHQNRQQHQHHEQHNHHNLLSSSTQASASDRRKRKSRRSIQREKLEQTFKEKGFLIQTQQLESAEGATYCKFRQLRKFTRYLFRSWKDYLPGEIQQANAAAVAAAAAAVANQQASPICDMMIEATSGNVQISATATEKLRKAANCSNSSSSS